MKFLSVIKDWIAKLKPVFAVVSPALAALIGGKAAASVERVTGELANIQALVEIAESIGGSVTSPLPGVEKLKGITPLVAQAVLTSSLMAGREIADEAAFKEASGKLAGAVADLINASKLK